MNIIGISGLHDSVAFKKSKFPDIEKNIIILLRELIPHHH
jgi:hypothetical protein